MTATELHFITVAEAARRIARRELSPVELTEAYLQRIGAFDDQLHSFVTLTADLARWQAQSAEAQILRDGPRSPLHGVPYCLKDIVETAGIRTTGQSKLLADHIPAEDAVVASKLRDAGGILLGKTATWEFAHGGPSWDVLFPPARNPWNTAHHPAGSSSGSGAAVAAGFAPATIGSDTGGSIRGPAAACGIAGLKPTYGVVSRRGVLPNCFSHDHVGPLAWTSEDVAIMLSIVAGHDPHDPGSADVPARDYAAGIDAPIAGTVSLALARGRGTVHAGNARRAQRCLGRVPRSWRDDPRCRAAADAALQRRQEDHCDSGAVFDPREGFENAAGAVRRQPALSHHRGRPGPRRGLRPGDAGAP
jgi:aspartyl-tRNA(Asn)/glutamyl-tRNA(Gln) amidotransferase subunit A